LTIHVDKMVQSVIHSVPSLLLIFCKLKINPGVTPRSIGKTIFYYFFMGAYSL